VQAVHGEPQASRPQLLREVAEIGDSYTHRVNLLSFSQSKDDSLPRPHVAPSLADTNSAAQPESSPPTLAHAASTPQSANTLDESPLLPASAPTLISDDATRGQNPDSVPTHGRATVSTGSWARPVGAARRVNPDNLISRAAKRAFLLQGVGAGRAGHNGYGTADSAAVRSLQSFSSHESHAGAPTAAATALMGENPTEAAPQAPGGFSSAQNEAQGVINENPAGAVPVEAAPMPRSASSVLKSTGVPANTAFTPFVPQTQDGLTLSANPSGNPGSDPSANPTGNPGPNAAGSAVKPTWWATPASRASEKRHAPAPKFATAESAKEYSDAYKYPVPKPSTMSKYTRPQPMDPKYVVPTASVESQAASISPESGFVRRSGTRFEVDGRLVFFVGMGLDCRKVAVAVNL
jgi:hypothetical protein